MHADDLADAAVFLMEHYSEEAPINVGVGTDVTIRELATLIARETGYHGAIEFDRTRPDGAPQKLLDISRLERLGWFAQTSLDDGVRATCRWYAERAAEAVQ